MHLLITISGEEIRLYEIYEELYGSIYLENYSIENSGVLLDGGKIVVLFIAVNFFSTDNRTFLFRVKDSELLFWLHCLGF